MFLISRIFQSEAVQGFVGCVIAIYVRLEDRNTPHCLQLHSNVYDFLKHAYRFEHTSCQLASILMLTSRQSRLSKPTQASTVTFIMMAHFHDLWHFARQLSIAALIIMIRSSKFSVFVVFLALSANLKAVDGYRFQLQNPDFSSLRPTRFYSNWHCYQLLQY